MTLSQNGTNSSTEKNGVQHVDERPAPRAGFGQKVKRHCARFWWLHLIVFCVCFLLIALLLVYVGLPRIAQHQVNDASLEFTDVQFLKPTPNSLTLTQKGLLHNPSIFTPSLDPFNGSLYVLTNGVVPADRMIQVLLPPVHATKPTSDVGVENQLVQIDNLDQVIEFATQIIHNEEVTTKLKGRTKLHIGKLPAVWIDFDQDTTSKGLNGLKGFNVTGARVNLTAKAGQPNLLGIAYIPNPSHLTIDLGNVTLSLATEKAGVVGNSTILNMTLKPGDNNLPLTGIIDQGLLLTSLDKDGFVDLQISAKESIYNGEHLVYYEKALSSANLALHMNVKQILADSVGGT